MTSWQGILVVVSSDDNLIVNNGVSKNKIGITVFKSSGNKIYHNSFIGNSQQGYDDGENIWSLENRGNYWSDYRGEGHTAYDIAPAGTDEHPLTESVLVPLVQVPEPAPLTFREVCRPPPQGIKDELKYENTEILMENSYLIHYEGKLVLENVTLRSYKEAASPYWISVKDGGFLLISNSRIIATEMGVAPISIEAKKGSALVIKDSELHHVGDVPSGGAITKYCDGAVIEGNLITDAIHGGDYPWVKELIEGNTVHDPIPAEKLSGWETIVSMVYRMLLYWLRDPRVIAGLSVLVIEVATLVWFLIRRRCCRKAEAAGTT